MGHAHRSKGRGVLQALLLAGLAIGGLTGGNAAHAAPSIVGSWYAEFDNAHITSTFLGDGTYFLISDYTGDGAHTGVEWGTFSWNEATGQISAVSLGDKNGNWGWADDARGAQFFSVSGNSATISQPDCIGCTPNSAQRILQSPDSIVGSWLIPHENGSGALTFFENGMYMLGQGGVGDSYGQPGLERGMYSWDSGTRELTVTSLLTDTNGVWGLSNPQGINTATLGLDGKLYIEEGGQPIGSFMSAAAPVPEPETYAMMLAGLGMIGAMVRCKQCDTLS